MINELVGKKDEEMMKCLFLLCTFPLIHFFFSFSFSISKNIYKKKIYIKRKAEKVFFFFLFFSPLKISLCLAISLDMNTVITYKACRLYFFLNRRQSPL